MADTPANYKDTLNLPQTAFPMKADLPKREPALVARWETDKLYDQIQTARADAPLFVLHDGPPFANGDVHIGTALNKILKDIIIKYKTMRGFRAPYVPGWDCHGQPIEYKVKQQLDKAGVKVSQAELRQHCRKFAERYIEVQRQQFRRLGVFGDWAHPYLTMSPAYEAEIIGVIADMVGAGYIYRGKKPVYWCASCRTALAEAEVEYAEHTSPSVYVKFPVNGRANEFAVIWTTTPWTLPANLAIAVKADLEYVRARTASGEIWILAAGLVERVAQACGVALTVVEKLAGAALEGLMARHPFAERNAPVILSPYVTLEQGTGLVHTAPGHGAEDYEIGQKYGLETLAPVNDSGVFTADAGAFAGQFVFKANGPIVEQLRQTGALAAVSDMQHSYPHCWRCKNPIIFRAMEQWFIGLDHAGLRANALAEVKRVTWVPAWGENRISGTIQTRPDWCISRQRAWGVPLPFLECQRCDRPLLDKELILRFREQVARDGVDIWFTREVGELFGKVTCPQCGGSDAWVKSPDIVDVWLESGVSHRAVLRQRPELRAPADLYLEGSDQHRGWFQSSLLTAMATENRAPFQTVLTHGFLLDLDRRKISKSQGKPANAEDYIAKYGADLLRLWVASENYQGDIPLSDEIFSQVSETYRKIRNTLRILLANLYDFTPARDAVPTAHLCEIDRWLVSRVQGLVGELTAAYDQYEFHRVYHLINAFCAVDLSSFYVDVTKDLMYTFAPNSPARRSAQTAMYETAATLARLLAPVLPFTAEEVWQQLPGREQSSVHLAPFPVTDAQRRDPVLEEHWEKVRGVRAVVDAELERLRASGVVGKSLEAQVVITADTPATQRLLENFGEALAPVLIVSQARIAPPTDGKLRVTVERATGEKCHRCWRWTEDVGRVTAHPALCGRCAVTVSGSSKSA